MVFGIADINFGLGDMNMMPFMCPLAPVKVGCGKGRPVKIITDNSVETVVFGNTNREREEKERKRREREK